MARTYKRDANGRFAGGGGGGGKGGGGSKGGKGGGGAKAKGGGKSASAGKGGGKAAGGTKKPARMTAQQKRDQISSAYSKREAAIRSSDPASAKLKNRALSPKAESRLARTKEGKRFNAVVERRVRQSQNAEASMSSGKGSKARRRAEAIGAKPKRGAPKGARGGKVGTASQQRKAAKEQQKRQAAFKSKATAGREAKAAYKARASMARFSRTAEAAGGGRAVKSSASGSKARPGQKGRAKLRASQVAARGLTSAPSVKAAKSVMTGVRAAEFLSKSGRKAKKSTAPKAKGGAKKKR